MIYSNYCDEMSMLQVTCFCFVITKGSLTDHVLLTFQHVMGKKHLNFIRVYPITGILTSEAQFD